MRISFNQKQEDIWSTRGHRLPSGPRRKSPVMSMGVLHANSGGTVTPRRTRRGVHQERLWPSSGAHQGQPERLGHLYTAILLTFPGVDVHFHWRRRRKKSQTWCFMLVSCPCLRTGRNPVRSELHNPHCLDIGISQWWYSVCREHRQSPEQLFLTLTMIWRLWYRKPLCKACWFWAEALNFVTKTNESLGSCKSVCLVMLRGRWPLLWLHSLKQKRFFSLCYKQVHSWSFLESYCRGNVGLTSPQGMSYCRRILYYS